MSFEERLSLAVASVLGLSLAGCPSTTPDGSFTTTGETGSLRAVLEAMCDGGPPPAEGYNVREGYVEVALGADCPDPADAQLSYYGCAHTEWQGVVCGPPRKEENMVFVNDGYGGYHTSATNAPTGTEVSEQIDVCWYQGVFFTDPDPTYTCGRPLLEEGRPVVAPVVPRERGWSDRDRPDLQGVSADERARLAAHWLDAAVMEHASIASFSQVSLVLLRFGAPPELLAATHRAAMDEVEHARWCFALAGAYRGAPVAPGPLVAPALAEGTLADFADALLREGCIGETLAAVDAAARLAQARDPAVRAALEVVVRDESEHAALAWRTLRWVLAADRSDGLRERLARRVAEEEARWSTAVESAPVSVTEQAHGLLDPRRRATVLARAWREVIAPSWAALAG